MPIKRPPDSLGRPLTPTSWNRRRSRCVRDTAYTAVAMPIYEYVCMECESHFEELVRNGHDPDCPDCGAENVRKQFSVFAAHGTAEQPSFGASGGGCCGGSCGCPRASCPPGRRRPVREVPGPPGAPPRR